MWPWWVKIPSEDFTDETLAINDTLGDNVIGGDCRWLTWKYLFEDLTDVILAIGDTEIMLEVADKLAFM